MFSLLCFMLQSSNWSMYCFYSCCSKRSIAIVGCGLFSLHVSIFVYWCTDSYRSRWYATGTRAFTRFALEFWAWDETVVVVRQFSGCPFLWLERRGLTDYSRSSRWSVSSISVNLTLAAKVLQNWSFITHRTLWKAQHSTSSRWWNCGETSGWW